VTPAQRRSFEKQLKELLASLATGEHDAVVEPNRTDGARTGGDEDEQPLNEMLQSIASNRNRIAGALKKRSERALAKLKDAPGDFGLCEECGDPIAPRRLAAMPFAEYCITCQSELDEDRGPSTRRKLTDYR